LAKPNVQRWRVIAAQFRQVVDEQREKRRIVTVVFTSSRSHFSSSNMANTQGLVKGLASLFSNTKADKNTLFNEHPSLKT
jgi:hypothetical protein